MGHETGASDYFTQMRGNKIVRMAKRTWVIPASSKDIEVTVTGEEGETEVIFNVSDKHTL